MTDDTRDPPIEAQNYIGGTTVVDIGDVRVARGMSRRHVSSCPHRQMVFDKNERRIWCRDCEHDVEPFDAFKIVVEGYDGALKSVKRREAAIAEVEKFKIRSIAAKTMDEAWRSQKMVPCCPHCRSGLLPEDFKSRPNMVSKEWTRARRTTKGNK